MKVLLELVKLRITVASATTTAVGWVMARGEFGLPLLPVLLGIFLQACGAAAFNHVQDARLDAQMPRTARRPIPAGRIGRGRAALFAAALLAAGTVSVALTSPLAALLGLAAAAVYNVVYTPMKRRTPFAVLPGSLIGALPPLAGWLAAGGYLVDPTIHQVAFFFFLWQVPHFWLLLLCYERDYAAGGLPSLFDRFDQRQIRSLTFVWILAVAVAALFAPLFAAVDAPFAGWLIAAAGVLLIVRAVSLLRGAARLSDLRPFKLRFMEINTFALLVMATLVVDGLR
jgi:protoheme IX farnesyltransferase